MKLFIRNAELADASIIQGLFSQLDAIHYDNDPTSFVHPSKAAESGLSELKNAINDSDVFVAVAIVDEKIVGCIKVSTYDINLSFLKPKKVADVNSLAVDSDCRKSGVGRALVNVAGEWAREQGAGRLSLEVMAFNQSAIDFYHHLGFTTTSKFLSKELSE